VSTGADLTDLIADFYDMLKQSVFMHITVPVFLNMDIMSYSLYQTYFIKFYLRPGHPRF